MPALDQLYERMKVVYITYPNPEYFFLKKQILEETTKLQNSMPPKDDGTYAKILMALSQNQHSDEDFIDKGFLKAVHSGILDLVMSIDLKHHKISNYNIGLGHAASLGYLDIVRYLLRMKHAEPGIAFRSACANGHLPIVLHLLGYPVDAYEGFRIALKHNQGSVVHILLGYVDPTLNENAAFRNAVAYNRLEMVQILLGDDRINPSACENEALEIAVNMNYIEIVKCLLRDARVTTELYDHIVEGTPNSSDMYRILMNDPRACVVK